MIYFHHDSCRFVEAWLPLLAAKFVYGIGCLDMRQQLSSVVVVKDELVVFSWTEVLLLLPLSARQHVVQLT